VADEGGALPKLSWAWDEVRKVRKMARGREVVRCRWVFMVGSSDALI